MYHKKDRENQRYNKVIIVVNIDDNTCSLKLIETKHKVLGLFYNYIFTKHCNKKKNFGDFNVFARVAFLI